VRMRAAAIQSDAPALCTTARGSCPPGRPARVPDDFEAGFDPLVRFAGGRFLLVLLATGSSYWRAECDQWA
jgi:hypothetical protein